MGKGGARRPATPETDLEHLYDKLAKLVREQEHLSFHGYQTLRRTQACSGADMAQLESLLDALVNCQPLLIFKYADLKATYQKLLQNFPALKSSHPVAVGPHLAGKYADWTMTLCSHARRLRDEKRFQEASKNLTNSQVQKLTSIKQMIENGALEYGEYEDKKYTVKSGNKKLKKVKKVLKKEKAKQRAQGSSEDTKVKKVKKAKATSSDEETLQKLAAAPDMASDDSMDTAELLDLEVPLTTKKDKKKDKLREEAEAVSPIPSRKKSIKTLVKQDKKKCKDETEEKAKQKEKKVLKKPAAARKMPPRIHSGVFKDVILMPYKEGRWAVRVRGGRQLFQISKFSEAKNKIQATKLIKMLQAGTDLKEVLAAKAKL
ncbi:unnamed protein product [Symbiodinium sp. CCMP2592]|nr:unnamed protein product [Symbiodinium sp. CCMP2592]